MTLIPSARVRKMDYSVLSFHVECSFRSTPDIIKSGFFANNVSLKGCRFIFLFHLQAIWNWLENYPHEFDELQKKPNDELAGQFIICPLTIPWIYILEKRFGCSHFSVKWCVYAIHLRRKCTIHQCIFSKRYDFSEFYHQLSIRLLNEWTQFCGFLISASQLLVVIFLRTENIEILILFRRFLLLDVKYYFILCSNNLMVSVAFISDILFIRLYASY